jgi:CDGSH-type Zn-finger protein
MTLHLAGGEPGVVTTVRASNLCPCGQSGNKPFCDGTHLTIDLDGTLAN